MEPNATHLRFGILTAVAAHVLWGMFPLYWRMLANVPPIELVCHRIVWSCAALIVFLPMMFRFFVDGGARGYFASLASRRVWFVYSIAALMIGVNWLAFLWACNNDRVLEASLGYYINPLISISLGVLVLGERLSRRKWIAVGWAVVGVAIVTVAGGGLPWVSLAMAFSFAFYGLAKKKAPLPSLSGLLIETALLSGPAVGYLVWTHADGGGEYSPLADPRTSWLLMAGGLVTVTPLLLFATACRHAPLSTIGVLQYIGPTLQFLVGTVILSEPLGAWRLVGFMFVWAGSLIYLFDRTQRAADVLGKTDPNDDRVSDENVGWQDDEVEEAGDDVEGPVTPVAAANPRA